MARIKTRIENPTDAEGNPVDISTSTGGSNPAFHLVPEGVYPAVVDKLTQGSFRAKYGGIYNDASPDQKWEYWKLTPSVTLLNDAKTVINRQDWTLSVIRDGAMYRPDGDTTKSPIFGSTGGCQYMLQALGLISKDGDSYELDFDTDHITDRVVMVRVQHAGYNKSLKRNYEPAELHKLLVDFNGGLEYTFEELRGLVDRYNEAQGFSDGEGLRLKNYIMNWFGVRPEEAEENGWFVVAQHDRSAQVFLTEASYEGYLALCESAEDEEAGEDW